ncbi:MAG: GIDE domain-containing protein [Pseudomonadota bacterium]
MEAINTLHAWANQSPDDEFWIWAIVLLIGTLVGFFFAFHYLHKKRLIEDTPTSKIRSAAQGYLELIGVGELMDGQPIIAPLTGTHCTWYQFTVEEKVESNNRSNWKVVRKGTSDELFLIKDETGECIIDPEGVSVISNEKDVWYGNQVTPMAKSPTSKSKFNLMSGMGGRYRYNERRLNIGESLYAIGLFKTTGGSGAKLNVDEDVRDIIREWKHDSDELLKKFDANNDGEIDMEEWEKVRDVALKQVLSNHQEQKNMPPVHLLSRTHDRRRPFMLSAVPQENLTRKLHWYATFFFSLFVLSGVLSTWIISVRLAT